MIIDDHNPCTGKSVLNQPVFHSGPGAEVTFLSAWVMINGLVLLRKNITGIHGFFPMKYDVFAVHVPLNQSIDTINQNHHVLKCFEVI